MSEAGTVFYEIDPRHTSQQCSCCGFISPHNRDKERFLCEACGYFADADIDAAVVIRQRGLKELGISLPQLPRVPGKVTPPPAERQGIRLGLPDGSGKPPQYLQLSLQDLFESREGT